MTKILFKKMHPDAQIPASSRAGDAGMDVYSIEEVTIPAGKRLAVKTGIASAFPSEYVALIWDRSGMAFKHGLKTMAGVIDSNYRGEWMIILFNTTDQDYEVKIGDRIAQAIIQRYESFETEEITELPESVRADGGFGSSGR